jgi:hypothetical protein
VRRPHCAVRGSGEPIWFRVVTIHRPGDGTSLTHDPMWFANVPRGPHLTLAGHTHGGQISLPGVGILKNASKAPLRWTHGLVRERGQYLYVTSGIGTSGVPLRWRVPPEFVVLDVTGRADAAISTVGAATGYLTASTV